MKQISKYREIRNNFVDEEDHKVYIDAWKTKNPNEEGSVIAKIDLTTYEVEYLDERAKRDPYAQEMIRETISDLKQFKFLVVSATDLQNPWRKIFK